MHVTQIIVQSLDITMEHFLSKVERGALAMRVSISIFDHNLVKSP
jgi:hypothetical protein